MGDPQGARPARARPVMIACPSCGRDNVGVENLAVVVEERLRDYPQAFEVAVMGCAVNGPGEAGDADFGIAGGRDVGFVYAHGRVLKKVLVGHPDRRAVPRDRPLDRGRHAAPEAAQDGEAGRARDGRGEPDPARVADRRSRESRAHGRYPFVMRLRPLHALVAFAFVASSSPAARRRRTRRAPIPRVGRARAGRRDRLRDPRHRRVVGAVGERRPTPRPVPRCALASSLESIRTELAQEDLTWRSDVAPALGDELVVVVTRGSEAGRAAAARERRARSQALIAKSDAAARAGHGRRLDGARRDAGRHRRVPRGARPRHARGRRVVRGRDDRASRRGARARLGRPDRRSRASSRPCSRSRSEATSASTGSRPRSRPRRTACSSRSACGRRTATARATSRSSSTRVPADAVAALSFGGTQGVLDRVEGAVDVDDDLEALEDTVGVSLDGAPRRALRRGRSLYVREGRRRRSPRSRSSSPRPTRTRRSTRSTASPRRLAQQAGEEVRTRTEGGADGQRAHRRGLHARVRAPRRRHGDRDHRRRRHRRLPRRRPQARRQRGASRPRPSASSWATGRAASHYVDIDGLDPR